MGVDILQWYLILINSVAFAAFGLDKIKAKRGSWRIRERTLLLLAALGGSAGALLAMLVFRHKIRTWKFRLGVPVILVLQIAAVLIVT